jgi:hypothetical protein
LNPEQRENGQIRKTIKSSNDTSICRKTPKIDKEKQHPETKSGKVIKNIGKTMLGLVLIAATIALGVTTGGIGALAFVAIVLVTTGIIKIAESNRNSQNQDKVPHNKDPKEETSLNSEVLLPSVTPRKNKNRTIKR